MACFFQALNEFTEKRVHYHNFNTWTPAECENHWCKEVGKAQTSVPAHVAQHYCDPEEPFYPLPEFKKHKRPQSLEFYNYLTKKTEFWFARPSEVIGLGVNFGILRGGMPERAGVAVGGRTTGGWEEWRARVDLAALSALCEVRTSQDLVTLREQLETPLQKPELNAR